MVLANPYIPHAPTIRQLLFLACPLPEVLFGGAAGGGKSDALLMAALQFVEVPGYTAMLFRKSYTDLSLPGALLDRAAEWLGPTAAAWHGQEKQWTFPGGGSLTFGYLDSANDHYRYQGAEFQFVGFDELTQFPETPYRYLFSRLRRAAGCPVPLRMRAATNPGGVGHGWVKERFLGQPSPSRQFIPSRLEDNPHLDRAEYERSLDQLDPFTRAQLLTGDWGDYTGGLFRREWFRLVDAAPADTADVRYWDLAGTEAKRGTDPDWTAGVRMGKDQAGVYWVKDVRRVRATPRDVESLVRRTAEEDGPAVRIVMEREPGSSGVGVIDHYTRNVLGGYAFSGDRVTGDKTTRASPFSTQAEAGNVRIVRGPWVAALLSELEVFPFGAHDDQVDAAAGAFGKLALPGKWKKLGVRVL